MTERLTWAWRQSRFGADALLGLETAHVTQGLSTLLGSPLSPYKGHLVVTFRNIDRHLKLPLKSTTQWESLSRYQRTNALLLGLTLSDKNQWGICLNKKPMSRGNSIITSHLILHVLRVANYRSSASSICGKGLHWGCWAGIGACCRAWQRQFDPRTHMVEGERTRSWKLPSDSTCRSWPMHTDKHM